MRHAFVYMLVVVCTPLVSLVAQERGYSFIGFGAFTTSSKLFPDPNNSDEFIRARFLGIDDIFSGGIELRRDIASLRTQISLSVEYLQKSETVIVPVSSVQVPVKDGFRAIPIEITGRFLIPFSEEHLQITIGGGIGVYLGNRIYEFPGAAAPTVERTMGFGIHITSGIEYFLNSTFSLCSDIKFRDVQFETVNQFSQPLIVYSGTVVQLPQEPMTSRMNIDGMTVTIGLAFHF